jgi:hypothetical protein
MPAASMSRQRPRQSMIGFQTNSRLTSGVLGKHLVGLKTACGSQTPLEAWLVVTICSRLRRSLT